MFDRGTELDLTFKDSVRYVRQDEPRPIQVIEKVIVVQEQAPRPKVIPAPLRAPTESIHQVQSRIQDDRLNFKVKRETKQERDKRTAKNSMNTMERQNKLRAEAAKKKKEEAMLRAQAMNGVHEVVYFPSGQSTEQFQTAVNKVRVVKRFEIGDEGNGPDIAAHFISDNIEKTID